MLGVTICARAGLRHCTDESERRSDNTPFRDLLTKFAISFKLESIASCAERHWSVSVAETELMMYV